MLPIKILLISADPATRHSISTCLNDAGYHVICSAHGSEAIELIHTISPLLVVLDIELPDFNSLAIIRTLRSEEFIQRIPVILTGSTLNNENVLLGLEVGADLCLQETFHPQVFVACVRSLLRRLQVVKSY